jgi:hypothetical protein
MVLSFSEDSSEGAQQFNRDQEDIPEKVTPGRFDSAGKQQTTATAA